MFYGCTSLTTSPVLKAPTLADGCYNHMFYGCSSLNYVTCLATSILYLGATSSWLEGVADNGTFVNNPSIDEATWGHNSNKIPNNWTVIDYQSAR